MRNLEIVNARVRASLRPAGGLVAAAVLVVLTACASGGRRQSDPFATEATDRDEIVIHVRNFNFNDATVSTIVRDGPRRRLGIVTGKSDATFTLRWDFTVPLRLEFDLLASVRCVTEELAVDPGDTLELQISVDPSQDPSCR